MASLRDRLLASDPPLERLRLGARATAATLLAGALLVPLYALHLMPGQAAAFGTLMALWSTVAANDPPLRARRITAALLSIPAFLAVCLTTLLNAIGGTPLASCAFVAVAAIAMLLRRFGPRGFGFGQAAIFAVFFALFVPLQPSWLGSIAIATAIGIACGWVVRFYVITDAPGPVLRGERAALRARMRMIRDLTRAAPRAGARLPQQMRRELIAFDAAVISLDLLLAGDAFVMPDATRARVREMLLRRQVAVDRCAAAALAHRGDTDAGDREPSAVAAAFAQADALGAELDLLLDQVACAPRSRTADAPISPMPRPPQLGGLPTPTREAIQVAVACGAALLIGGAIPPHQDAWAALIAFIVFNGAASSGEIRNRGIARTIGTFGGVIAGTLLVAAVGAQHILAAVLGVAALFATFYTFRASYALFTFFLIACVAMIYELVGRPADQLLLTRLMETLIGVACGLLTARFVLPLRTRDVVAHSARTFAERLASSVDASVARMTGAAGADPIAAARASDAALQDLIARSAPLRSPRRGEHIMNVDETLAALAGAGVHARALADASLEAPLRQAQRDSVPENVTASDARNAVNAALAAFSTMLEGRPESFVDAESVAAKLEVQTMHDTGTVTDAAHALRLLAGDIRRLSQRSSSLLSS
jgi:uncharacterized membrane protein YccC